MSAPPGQPSWVNTGAPYSVQWDPGGSAMGFYQPKFHYDPKSGSNYFLSTDAPARLGAFGRQAHGLIADATRGAYLEQSETLSQQQRDAARQIADQFSVMGLSPAAFFGTIQPQQQNQFAQQDAALRGGAIAGQAQGELDLAGQITSALNQIEAYYDSLGMQWNLAAKARSAERSGGKLASLTSLGGALLGAGGMALGGPGGLFSSPS